MNPFDMLKNLGNLGGLKEQLEQTQEKLSTLTATGSSGGNMVNITVNGKFELLDIRLDPICVDNRDIPMLQDLIKAAHHDAIVRVQDQIKAELGPMFSGLNLPGLGL